MDVDEVALELELALLPPLWKISSEYLDPAEQWYYADVAALQLDSSVVSRNGALAKREMVLNALFKTVVEFDHFHILEALYRHARQCCGGEWGFVDSVVVDMVRLDRVQMLEFVRVHRADDLDRYYSGGRSARGVLGFELIMSQNQAYRIGYYGLADISAVFGSLNVLEWERHHGLKKWSAWTAELLARGGHIAALQRLRAGDDKCPWDSDTYCAAVGSGNVPLVRWLESFDDAVGDSDPLGRVNTVEMLKYFVNDSRFICKPEVLMRRVVDGGTLEMVKYLIERTSIADDLSRSEIVMCACDEVRDDPAKLEYLLGRGFPKPKLEYSMGAGIRAWFVASGYEYRC